MPSASQHSTASDIGSSSSPTARHSSGSNGPSTKSASSVEADGHGPDADPEAGVVLPLKRALDALEAVVAARRARAAQTELPHGEGDVVDQHQQVGGGVEVRKRAERRESRAAPVHVRLGLEHDDRTALDRPFHLPRALATREGAEPPARGEVVRQSKPGIVPGFVVLRAGVSQPHDGAQRLRPSGRSRPRPRPWASG